MSLLRINLSKLQRAVYATAPTNADIDRLLQGLAAAARQRWIALAQANLRTTARDYIAGIQDVEIKNRVARIALVGTMPNMVEQGISAFDLRTTLLSMSAKNAKTAADGSRYNTVPFSHGSSGSSGRSAGPPMPRSIQAVAKKLGPSLSRPGGGTKWGEKLQNGPGTPKAAAKILNTKEKPWHWGSTYLGMARQQKQYAKATQNKYMTFRRISSNVRRADAHWLHPGIRARRFAEQVQREIAALAGTLLPSTLKNQGPDRK